MPVRRRAEKRRASISDAAWKILNDLPLETEEDTIEAFILDPYRKFHIGVGPALIDLWAQHRDQILADWTATKPGTRPVCWWCYDAPREPVGPTGARGGFDSGEVAPMRRRIGGSGTPKYQ